MASNALIGKTITKGKNKGKIKVYYSHWGEANAHTAGENKPQPPEQDLDFEQIVKDKKEFGKIIDYVFCEAVWLDGECFRPIYIHSSRYMMSRKGKWKREGLGCWVWDYFFPPRLIMGVAGEKRKKPVALRSVHFSFFPPR